MTHRNKRPSQTNVIHADSYREVLIERCDGCKRFVPMGSLTEYVVVNLDVFMDLCRACIPAPLLALLPGGVE